MSICLRAPILGLCVMFLLYMPINGFWVKNFAIQKTSSQSVPFTYNYVPEMEASCQRRRRTRLAKSVASSDIEVTAAGGRPHTELSRAKISAANKGKTPWNTGKQHSEETKRRIAEKTKEAMLKRKIEKAAAMGMTLEEMEAHNLAEKQKKKELAAASKPKGITEDGRKRISESLRRRWEDPEFRRNYSERTRGSRKHSMDTRARISEKIKLKWQDAEYRAKIMSSPSQEVRARISATLKARWEDPVFREKMLQRTFQRTEEWKTRVAEKIRLKWADPTYRAAVEEGIRSSNKTLSYLRVRDPNAPIRRRTKREKKDEAARLAKKMAKAEKDREKKRQKTLKAAKKAIRDKPKQSIKELLGSEIWFEEKLRRTKSGSPYIEDDVLEATLRAEWLAEAAAGDEEEELGDEVADGEFGDDDTVDDEDLFGFGSAYSSSEDDMRDEFEGEDLEWFGDDDEDLDLDDQMDVIEVYDEDGELVGTYTAAEFEKIRGQKSA